MQDMAPRTWTFAAAILWAAVVAVALWVRPPLPVDETRYLAVAWEMWHAGDYLVPHLNGETYSHKPPMLFWLMTFSWALFGVNEWSAGLIAPLFGLGCLFLTARLTRLLWPGLPAAEATASLVLFGAIFWTVFTTLTMFDMMLALFTLVALIGLLRAWRATGSTETRMGFLLFGAGIGLGVLAKGPAILLHTLPVALLAPLWGSRLDDGERPKPAAGWRSWYLGVVGGVLIGAAIGLAWAIPAAIKGGGEFAHAIFIGQSAGRMVESFAHQRPWWWYLALILPLLLPWTIWPALWRAVAGPAAWRAGRGLGAIAGDGATRFCLAWFLPAFVAFSLISGKQLHYLLPDFPALAILVAVLIAKAESGGARAGNPAVDQAVPGIFAAIVGTAAFFVPFAPLTAKQAERILPVAPIWMLMLALAGLLVAAMGLSARPRGATGRIFALSCLSAVAVVSLHLAARPKLQASMNLQPVAERLADWQRNGEAIAHMGKYHGQFNFIGRLTAPVTPIGLAPKDIETWLEKHPKGKVVSYRSRLPRGVVYSQPYKTDFIVVWDREDLARDPDIADRD